MARIRTTQGSGGRVLRPLEPDGNLRERAKYETAGLLTSYRARLDTLEQEYVLMSPVLWRKDTLEILDEVEGIVYWLGRTVREAFKETHTRIATMHLWCMVPPAERPTMWQLELMVHEHLTVFGFHPQAEREAWNKQRRIIAPLVFQRDGQACVRCEASHGLDVDHIVPLRLGGGNYGLNLQTMCGRCNGWKKARVWWPGMSGPWTTAKPAL